MPYIEYIIHRYTAQKILSITLLCLSFFPIFSDSNTSHKTITDDKLRDLCTLAYSDNVDLQRSAALCFSELSEKCEPLTQQQNWFDYCSVFIYYVLLQYI